jgi:hypothetical protein
MGGHLREKTSCFQWHIVIISRHIETLAHFFCARVNGSLSIKVTGNNSGALLLTTFVLTLGAATNGLPRGERRPRWHGQIAEAY